MGGTSVGADVGSRRSGRKVRTVSASPLCIGIDVPSAKATAWLAARMVCSSQAGPAPAPAGPFCERRGQA